MAVSWKPFPAKKGDEMISRYENIGNITKIIKYLC
jgi:hypothetical protein